MGIPGGPLVPFDPTEPGIPGKPGSPLGPAGPIAPNPRSPFWPGSPGRPWFPGRPSTPGNPGSPFWKYSGIFYLNLFIKYISNFTPCTIYLNFQFIHRAYKILNILLLGPKLVLNYFTWEYNIFSLIYIFKESCRYDDKLSVNYHLNGIVCWTYYVDNVQLKDYDDSLRSW